MNRKLLVGLFVYQSLDQRDPHTNVRICNLIYIKYIFKGIPSKDVGSNTLINLKLLKMCQKYKTSL
jgi:hypothetical protein